MRKELAGFIDSSRRRGLGATLRLLASDLAFDRRHGIETRRVLEGPQLGLEAHAPGGEPAVYHGVNPWIFALAIERLQALSPTVVHDGSFVDFGSGKGRGLVLAARAGFGKVVGVEHSPVLHAQCERNLHAVWRRFGLSTVRDLHLGDAAQFTVPDESCVWFWFNPFGADLVCQVTSNLLASLRRRPREAYLVYARPLHAAVLRDAGFAVVAEVRSAPHHLDALVYTHPAARDPSHDSFEFLRSAGECPTIDAMHRPQQPVDRAAVGARRTD